ncbi:MAG: HAD-IA family hydrolase [Armatimonadota bacterium]|nr:HAD-IA family hydrolase [Armatimonadota bacterium]
MTEAAIFDIDGVLVDSPHERAWGETLCRLMREEWREVAPSTRYAPERYTTDVYQQVVSGKPREEGATALLRYFGIPDPDGKRTQRLCDLKQRMIVELIERGEFTAFEDGLRFLLRLKAKGVKLAAASSSKNANKMLERVWLHPVCERHGLHYPFVTAGTRLIDLFDANVCGRDFAQGKPHPEIFLTAAALLGVPPERCVVVEDAPVGVQAAKAGGMRCIGVARRNDAHLLRAAGADRVVTNLDEVNLEEL